MVVSPVTDQDCRARRSRTPQVALIADSGLFGAVVTRLLTDPPVAATVVRVDPADAPNCGPQLEAADLVLVCVEWTQATSDLVAALSSTKASKSLIVVAEKIDIVLTKLVFQAGAAGFFSRFCSVSALVDGIDAVLKGHRAIDTRVLDMLLVSPPAADPTPPRRLTPAESRVLTMMAEAKSVQTIAVERDISCKTVRNQIASIYQKLGVTTRAEAMTYAARIGLVSERRG